MGVVGQPCMGPTDHDIPVTCCTIVARFLSCNLLLAMSARRGHSLAGRSTRHSMYAATSAEWVKIIVWVPSAGNTHIECCMSTKIDQGMRLEDLGRSGITR